MVQLVQNSLIDQKSYPFGYSWDQNVRKHYNAYQHQIDKQTYRLQKIRRFLFSLSFPKYYHYELSRLKLLQAKQDLGQIHQHQIDQYKKIEPCITTYFNRAFNGSFFSLFSNTSLITSGGLLAFSSYFNFTILHRFMLTILPLAISALHNTNNSHANLKTSEFLNWVTEMRKAKAFVQISRSITIPPHKQLNNINVESFMQQYITEVLKIS